MPLRRSKPVLRYEIERALAARAVRSLAPFLRGRDELRSR